MTTYTDIVASVEARREARVLLKAEGRTDSVWVERNTLSPVSQRLVDSAPFGEDLELTMERAEAEKRGFA